MPYSNPALDALALPRALPADVARTLQDGKPTEDLVDYEEKVRSILKRSVAALNSADAGLDHRIDVVQSEVDDPTTGLAATLARLVTEETTRATADAAEATARLTLDAQVNDATTGLPATRARLITEETTRATADTALAASITSVQAEADSATASGQIRLIAVSAPGGVDASFAIELKTATPGVWAQAGLYLDLIGSTSRLRIVANQFQMTDPSYNGGDATEVFAYASADGVFHFFVPVEVRNQDIGANAVSNGASGVGNIASGSALAVPITLLAGTRVLVVASATDYSGSSVRTSSGGALSPIQRSYSIGIDGTATGETLDAYDQLISSAFVGGTGGSAWQFQSAASPVSASYLFTGLGAGSHNITLFNPNSFTTRLALTVTEQRDV